MARADGEVRRGRRAAGAVAAGRGRPGQCARDAPGRGGGKSLMLNGHMDTSYSGREPWLAGRPGVQAGAVRERRPALRARHLEHERRARLLRRGGSRAAGGGRPAARGRAGRGGLRGDREDAVRRRAGRRVPGLRRRHSYLVTHGGLADMCLLGEPTEGKVVLGHFGSLWLRISTHGNFVHTAFSEGNREQNSILRMREVLDARAGVGPDLGGRPRERLSRLRRRSSTSARSRVGSAGACRGLLIAPTCSSTCACRRRSPCPCATREVLAMARELAERFPDYGVEGEVYVTAPGAEIDEGHQLVAAIDAGARGGLRRAPRSAT